MDVGRAIGLERDLGLAVGIDLRTIIEQTRPDVAIQSICSNLADAMGEVRILVGHGVPVISSAERLHASALAHGVAAATSGNSGAAVASQAAKAGLGCIVVRETEYTGCRQASACPAEPGQVHGCRGNAR
jgi:hypothetical protein